MLAAAASAAIALAAAQTPTCIILGATGVAFGAYDPLGANRTVPRDATGQLQYRCTGGANPLVTLSAGSAGSFQPRLLVSGGSSIAYNLYSDAARTTIWGDGTGGTQAVVGGSGNKTLVIYGRIFAGQASRPGAYADTIVSTFNF